MGSCDGLHLVVAPAQHFLFRMSLFDLETRRDVTKNSKRNGLATTVVYIVVPEHGAGHEQSTIAIKTSSNDYLTTFTDDRIR